MRGELGERPLRRRHDPQDLEGGDDAVARGRVLADDDVAALLATEAGPRDLHPLEDVLVADGRPDDGPAGGLDGGLEAAVREDRDDEGPAGQGVAAEALQGQHAEDLVTVDDVAGRVDRDEPVGVAVEGEPDVGAALGDRPGQRPPGRWPRSGG